MKQLKSFKKGWALMLALVLTATFAGASYATNSTDNTPVVAQTSAPAAPNAGAIAEEVSGPGDRPADVVDTTSVLGDFQCDSMTMDVTTMTTTTSSVLNDAGDGWDQVTSTERFTTSNDMTAEEQATCAPSTQAS